MANGEKNKGNIQQEPCTARNAPPEGVGSIELNLTQAEIDAIKEYTGDAYININDSLRGLDTMTDENKIIHDHLSSALDRARLPSDMILYRGASTQGLGALRELSPDELIGKIFTEQAYMSTSTIETVAEGIFGDMLMTIHAPMGAKGLDVSSISAFTHEAEILFQAGTKMLIIDAKIIDGIHHIVVEILL